MRILLLIVLLAGCRTTLELEVTNCYDNSSKKNVTIKARKSICIAKFDDSIERIVDYRNRILVDSVCDYKVLKIKK